MSCRKFIFPAMPTVAFFALLLLHSSAFASAQNKAPSSSSKWQTLTGSSPLIIARGGFSGAFPDSSFYAYKSAMITSVPDVVLWCDVQLTKDGSGICFPDLMLSNSSNINDIFPNRAKSYLVNGVQSKGVFAIDFNLKELAQVSLTQGLYSRTPDFDGSQLAIMTVEEVFTQNKPGGFWLNIQNDAFYNQHKLSMRSFVIRASKTVIISHISSPDISFLRGLARPFASTKTKLVFRFLDQDIKEPSTNHSYGALLKNLTFIKSFASAILVPKEYIWNVDPTLYLQSHTSLVANAHKSGLEIFAAGFANDINIAYNYSYNPVAEYVNFIDNGDFAVDGVLSDFPVTPSEARECFAHLGSNASARANALVISSCGASGYYPGCTDQAYEKAISDGADVIDCPVQLSSDGVPFCLSSVNLMNCTLVAQTPYVSYRTTIPELQATSGVYSFSLKGTEIQSLTPVISNPFPDFLLVRNPKFRTVGKIFSLSDFLDLAKNATSVSRVMIKIENATYLATKQGLDIHEAVLSALDKAGYNGPGAKRVMIRSTSSAVLKAMKGKKYELVYEVVEAIRDAPKATIADIKSYADSVIVNKETVFPTNQGLLLNAPDVVTHLQAFNLSVYVRRFTNEFVSIAYDFFSDPIAELNSFVLGAGINGVITDYPETAVAYKKNRCLKLKDTPSYMTPVQPGQLIQLVNPQLLPPAEAPYPILTVADVSESPLPPVAVKNNSSPPSAEAPKTSPNGQRQIVASALVSCLAMIVAVALTLLYA